MKVLAWPIEVIVWFNNSGIPTPLKIRMENSDELNQVIKVDRVIQFDKEKVAGNILYVFKCQSVIENIEKIYELKYELSTCKWMLFKI